MVYDEHQGGMLCLVCTKYGKPPVQVRGAWVTRAINNWPKATDLLKKHESSEWHLAALEAQGMALLGQKTGNVLDRIIAASDEEKRRNREVIKTLIRSLYFLVKHRVPHTTTFNDLISLQADNGNEIIKQHLSTCAGNATYLSKATSADFIECIGHHIDSSLLGGLKASPFYSIMADESTDISLKEELSVCGRWIENGKAVEHFLGIIRAKEVTAKALTQYMLDFLQERGIPIQKLRGLRCDGASAMSGSKGGVQIAVPPTLARCFQYFFAIFQYFYGHFSIFDIFDRCDIQQ